MTIPFDYPPDNLTGIVSFFNYVNSLVRGLLGVAILVIVGFVAFFSTKGSGYSTDRSLGFASFITMLSAVFLRFLSLINDGILLLVIVIFIGSVIYLIRERNVENFGV